MFVDVVDQLGNYAFLIGLLYTSYQRHTTEGDYSLVGPDASGITLGEFVAFMQATLTFGRWGLKAQSLKDYWKTSKPYLAGLATFIALRLVRKKLTGSYLSGYGKFAQQNEGWQPQPATPPTHQTSASTTLDG